MLQLLIALLAGIVTIGGPCILPLLPIILGTSTANRHPLRPIAIVAGFVIAFTGFALIFSFFGSFLGLRPDTWRIVAAVLISLFGVIMIFPKLQTAIFAKIESKVSKITPKNAFDQSDLASGFILGLTLGAIWTPCAGPVLGSILTLIAAKQSIFQATILLTAFSIGAGIPMLLIAYGGQYAIQKVQFFAKYSGRIQQFFGLVIILVAIGLITKTDILIQTWLLENYPQLFFGLNFEL